MEKFQLFLLILQIIIAAAMIVLVLLQKSDGDSLSGIGGGSGGLGSVISSKASANILSKTTMILIGVFMINCLILASLTNIARKQTAEQLEEVIKQQESTQSGDAASSDKARVPLVPAVK